MLPPSGEQIILRRGELAATITESGAALRALAFRGRALIAGFEEQAMADGGRGQILMPWPNRIRDGRYTFAETTYQLALTEPARSNASHGLVRWVAWTPTERTTDSVTMRYRLMAQTGYPWTLDLAVRYSLDEAGLQVTQSALNRSGSPAPYASGAHPYLCIPGRDVDALDLLVPAASRLLVDERLLPTGVVAVAGTDHGFTTPRTIGGLDLNDGYVDLTRGDDGRSHAELRDPDSGDGVRLWVDAHHTCLQVYTGEPGTRRDSLAIEPMTAPPDAFTSGDGLVVIEPGARFEATWGIEPLVSS